MSAIGDIDAHVRSRPDAAALNFSGVTLSWREVDALQRRLAAKLVQQGCRTSVALVLPQSPALAMLFLAAARMGSEVQILDLAWPEPIISEMLKRLQPDVVIRAETLCAQAADPDRALDFEGLAAWSRDETPLECWPDVNPRSSFYVGFTSGTTGLPKGYRRHHLSWLESFAAARGEFPIGPHDVVCAPGALTHSLFLFALAYAMNEGSPCVLSRHFRPDHCIQLLKTSGATVLFSVPVHLGLLARLEGGGPAGQLRQIVSSGSKFRPQDIEALAARFPNASLCEFYGASETSFISVAHDIGPPGAGCVGRPFAGVAVTIRDPQGHEVSRGTIGRICVKSEMLFSGYAGADETAGFLADGSLATEDAGFLDDRGQLHLSGRQGRMIVTSAKNLFPEEVEATLENIEGVRRAAVIGVMDAKRGERPVAYIEFERGVALQRAQIIAAMRKSLPAFKAPRDIAVLNDWPLTSSGKVDYMELKRRWPDAKERLR